MKRPDQNINNISENSELSEECWVVEIFGTRCKKKCSRLSRQNLDYEHNRLDKRQARLNLKDMNLDDVWEFIDE